jgi:hypothetical protein
VKLLWKCFNHYCKEEIAKFISFKRAFNEIIFTHVANSLPQLAAAIEPLQRDFRANLSKNPKLHAQMLEEMEAWVIWSLEFHARVIIDTQHSMENILEESVNMYQMLDVKVLNGCTKYTKEQIDAEFHNIATKTIQQISTVAYAILATSIQEIANSTMLQYRRIITTTYYKREELEAGLDGVDNSENVKQV